MTTKAIKVSLPDTLLKRLDVAAAEEFTNRSEFIRQAVIDRLRVVDQYRVKLANAAANTNVPTEEEIFELLRQRRLKRGIKQSFKNAGMR